MARTRKSDAKTARPAKAKTSKPSRIIRQTKIPPASTFPVVGIGASAGGLTAVTQLLKALPPNLGIAVVVIQHLDPKHGSLTAEILSRVTLMSVTEVREGMQVEPDNVYVIPPNRTLQLSKGILKLSPRMESRGAHLPINFFFRSLADDRKDLAIGVVLSGIASDGTMGLQAIKSNGGVTFAQDPNTAQYDGMPRSAISSGAVDIVASPTAIAEEIGQIAKVLPGQPVSISAEKRISGPQGQLHKIFAILRSASGVDFTHYKQSTIQRRIARRQFFLKQPNLQSYANYVADHPEESKALFEDLLIPVTSFFRDPESFDFLKRHILPKCIKNKEPGVPVRIWVAGCSTGEEAYSIAIAFLELIDNGKDRPLQIFASDISEQNLQRARRGIYPASIAKDVSKARLQRFFVKTEGGGYRIDKSVRDTCLFSKHDVTRDPPFAKVDLISCRNVLIYFAVELQRRIIPIFHYALAPGGILWLGRSESVGPLSNLFAIEDRTNKFYSRKQIATTVKIAFPIGHQVPEPISTVARKMLDSTSVPEAIQREADRVALSEYAPPGVVINDASEILQVRGRPAPYLELASGQATLNLFKLARPEIVSDLRYLINAARRGNKPVKKDVVLLNGNDVQPLGIRVVPLRLSLMPKERCFSIFFERTVRSSETPAPGAGGKKVRETKPSARHFSDQQLVENQKYHQALIEEYETTQEELTSANEELQSTNEELQSTNEELETAKEELQSANEEMTTVNDELQNRNAEVTQVSSDLTNILASVDIPIVIVGRDAKIRSFTAKAGQILRLTTSDIERPIGDLRLNIEAVDLDDLTSSVITTMSPKEVETQDNDGAWYRVQVKPYRTLDNKIDGAVIALVDITALKHAAGKLKSLGEDARMILETTPIPILVITPDRRVQAANQSFYKTFDVEPSETEGKFLSELGAGQWNIASLLTMLEAVFTQGKEFKGLEIELEFPKIGHKCLLVNARRSYLAGAAMQIALFAIEDITARKEIARQLEKTEEKYRNLLENARDGIVVVNRAGVIEFANHQAATMFGYSAGELKNQDYEGLVPDAFRDIHQRHHARYLGNPEPRDMGRQFDLSAKRKDGSVFPVDISLSPIKHGPDLLVTAIIRDISERKKFDAERQKLLSFEKEARLSAEKANRIKDDFLATLSHELRTPLATILSWTQILRLGKGDPKKGIVVIEKSANDQSQLIDDLLDIPRIQAGKLHLEFSAVDPADAVQAAVESIRALAEEKSITLQTEIETSDGKITADPLRLQQVLRNLLTNSLKFTPPGGSITVQLSRVGEPSQERFQFQVRDTGRGIKPEFLPLLFNRFTQEDSSTTRSYAGLGLGLSIVRQLVELHGGTVTAESPGEGKGAVFTVSLPIAQSGSPSEKISQKPRPQITTASGPREPAQLDGMRTLVIDDVLEAREGFQVFLQSLGAEVRTASSAREGFVALKKFKPDVILCDIAMPEEDGYSLMRRIRKLPPGQGRNIPAIALTAYAAADDVRRALDAKFDFHLAKPVDLVTLSQVIAKLFKKSKKK